MCCGGLCNVLCSKAQPRTSPQQQGFGFSPTESVLVLGLVCELRLYVLLCLLVACNILAAPFLSLPCFCSPITPPAG